MTMTIEATVLDTPVGPLALLAHADALVAGGFTADPAEMQARLDVRHRAMALRRLPDLGALSKAVCGYFDGDLAAVDDVPVEQSGTPLHQAVWQALRDIPAGATSTYGDLARAVGAPRAYRAVGGACGRNLIAPVVPCHRAVRVGGAVGGYYYGASTKRWLLDHERRHAVPVSQAR